jgi:hypothetical protein
MQIKSSVNDRNIFITGKPLKQGYRYYKLRKYFTKFNNRNFELILKCNSDLKIFLRQGISQSDFYGYVRSWVKEQDEKKIEKRKKRKKIGLRVRFGAPLTGLNSPAVLMLLTVPRRRPSVFLTCMSVLFYTVLVTLLCPLLFSSLR